MKIREEDQIVVKIVRDVVTELNHMIKLHGPLCSVRGGYAILEDKVDDLWDSIQDEAPEVNMRANAIQVAASALRFIIEVTEDEK